MTDNWLGWVGLGCLVSCFHHSDSGGSSGGGMFVCLPSKLVPPRGRGEIRRCALLVVVAVTWKSWHCNVACVSSLLCFVLFCCSSHVSFSLCFFVSAASTSHSSSSVSRYVRGVPFALVGGSV